MKRIVAMVLALVLALSLVGCGSTSREFSLNGHNISSIDTNAITGAIRSAEKLDEASSLYVNADNFELRVTSNFDWSDDPAIKFFYLKNKNTYSAQIRIFNENDKCFITESTRWVEQGSYFLLENFLDALKYMPQEEIRRLSSDADGYIIVQTEEGVPDDYDKSIMYNSNGVTITEGWVVHLSVMPLHKADDAFTGSGDETIHLFYEAE